MVYFTSSAIRLELFFWMLLISLKLDLLIPTMLTSTSATTKYASP